MNFKIGLSKGSRRASQAGLPSRVRRRLDGGITSEIRQLKRLRELLDRVDREVFEAGMALFGTERNLALWLCAPAHALGGKTPLRVMHRAKGRRQVAHILRAMAHGVVL